MTELVIAAGGELHFQLVVHIPGTRDPIRDFTDEAFFLDGIDRPAQGDPAVVGDDLYVLGVHRHVFPSDDFFANLLRFALRPTNFESSPYSSWCANLSSTNEYACFHHPTASSAVQFAATDALAKQLA